MKNLTRLAIVCLTGSSLALGGAGGPRNEDSAPTGESALLECMEGLKSHLKGAATSLRDPKRSEEALGHVAEMQRLALLAKLEQPANLASIPEARRAAHATGFRRDMALLVKELLDMEIELLDGEPQKAFARVTGSLYELRETAHGKYQETETSER